MKCSLALILVVIEPVCGSCVPHGVVWPMFQADFMSNLLKALPEAFERSDSSPPPLMAWEHLYDPPGSSLGCLGPNNEVSVALSELLYLACFADPQSHAQPKPEVPHKVAGT